MHTQQPQAKEKPLSAAISKIVSLFYYDKAYVYRRANERYNYLVRGGDLVNIAPIATGQELVNVEPGDTDALLALGATLEDEKWLMPATLDEGDVWKFKKWFPRATKDLESNGSDWYLTTDGRSTNGYILPEDLRDGNDSTATSLIMGAFPVIFAAGYALWQFPVIGPWVATAVSLPLLVAHAMALYQSEDFQTVVKTFGLSWLLPLVLLSGKGGAELNTALGGGYQSAVLAVAVIAGLSMSVKKSETKTAVIAFGEKAWMAIKVLGAVLGVNWLLGMVPESLSFVKPAGIFAVACAYPLLYTLENYQVRTKQLELQSKQRAGAMEGQTSLLGKNSPTRLSQIQFAARDKTPFTALGSALGVMSKFDYALAPDPFQVMGLTVKDLSTHLHIFGATGTGKTSSILRVLALRLAMLIQPIGMIFTDGKGAFVADMRELLDIIIEPGTKFAPFQGLDSEEITSAFAEARNEDLSNSDSIWVKGAGTFHRFALALLEAARKHELALKERAKTRLMEIRSQLKYVLAEVIKKDQLGQSSPDQDATIKRLQAELDAEIAVVDAPRRYRWTPSCYSDVKDILSVPVMGANGFMRANNKSMALFEFLGWTDTDANLTDAQHAYQADLRAKFEADPSLVYPDLRSKGKVLERAITYFTLKWPNTDEKQRSSFLINIDEDILGFLKSDKLRGNLLADGVQGEEQAWADTEEGIDITQVVYGKRLGVNLPATQYGEFGKLISKLVKTRIYREIKLRNEKYGEAWQEKTGQTIVMDMCDECQDMVSKMEIDLTATARSMGLIFVNATQMLESLDKVMPSYDSKMRYLENFRSLATFKSSEATYKVFQKRAGKIKKLKLPLAVQSTIDTTRAIDTTYQTIYMDPNHPSAHALRQMRRRGSTRLQVVFRGHKPYMGLSRKVRLDDLEEQNYIEVQAGGTYEEAHIIEDSDLTTNLAQMGHALFYFNRASHDRIDFVKTNHIEAKDVGKYIKKWSEQQQQAA